jgi:translation elongation factor EF-1alpha
MLVVVGHVKAGKSDVINDRLLVKTAKRGEYYVAAMA